jgi:5S rRNA maturation endonuclease (ribonuclease M5)
MSKTTSHSYSQSELKLICDELCDRIEDLFEALSIDTLKLSGKMYTGKCPIHDGDNSSAFNLYHTGDHYRGNWKCRTHNCEKFFKASILGFIRGVLSKNKFDWSGENDETVSFTDTISFVKKFLGNDLNGFKISGSDIEKKKFSSVINYITTDKPDALPINRINRKTARSALNIPSEYFINRGYRSEILDKYDVGLCNTAGKEMFERVVVPIYNHDYKFIVGCSGRSIFDKCETCKFYHSPNKDCPNDDNKWLFSKWRHSKNFQAQNHLYNFWFAQEHISQTNQVIIVESPGNVWRLEENGIHNSVAIFGSSLSNRQKILLDSSGAMDMIILTDNDEAGQKAAEQIRSKCENTYRIFIPKISKADVGEMNSEEIQNEIKQYIKEIS